MNWTAGTAALLAGWSVLMFLYETYRPMGGGYTVQRCPTGCQPDPTFSVVVWLVGIVVIVGLRLAQRRSTGRRGR